MMAGRRVGLRVGPAGSAGPGVCLPRGAEGRTELVTVRWCNERMRLYLEGVDPQVHLERQ